MRGKWMAPERLAWPGNVPEQPGLLRHHELFHTAVALGLHPKLRHPPLAQAGFGDAAVRLGGVAPEVDPFQLFAGGILPFQPFPVVGRLAVGPPVAQEVVLPVVQQGGVALLVFYGHSIHVSGDMENGPDDAAMEG